jgi:hypothetical protein
VTFRGGHASAPAGVAPEALEEYVHSYKVFCVELPIREAFVSIGLSNAMCMDWHLLTIGHVQEV